MLPARGGSGNLFAAATAGYHARMRLTLGLLGLVVLAAAGLEFAAAVLAVTAAIVGVGQYVLDALDAHDRSDPGGRTRAQ